METIDNELPAPFEIKLNEADVEMGGGIRGWSGTVTTAGHKYQDMLVMMTPRHVDWDGAVVLKVNNGPEVVFSGMAKTAGLERSWA